MATFKVTFKIVFPLLIVGLFYIFSHVETGYYPRPGCPLSPLGMDTQLGWQGWVQPSVPHHAWNEVQRPGKGSRRLLSSLSSPGQVPATRFPAASLQQPAQCFWWLLFPFCRRSFYTAEWCPAQNLSELLSLVANQEPGLTHNSVWSRKTGLGPGGDTRILL